MNKAIILDRDGTINFDYGYVFDKNKLKFIDNISEAIKLANNKGFLVIVITNQSAIGRNMCSKEDVESFNENMIQELRKLGANIDHVYYCPHVDEDNCDCRKPKDGLFKQAIIDFNIDITKSYAIGDNVRDIVPFIKMGGNGALLFKENKDYICIKNIYDFISKL